MGKPSILGWDIGGAHLKAVLLRDGRAHRVIQQPCPLWRGVAQLEQAVRTVVAALPEGRYRHAVTMTGELADIFPDRASGVSSIIACMQTLFPGDALQIYAGPRGFLHSNLASSASAEIASANWHASAAMIAGLCQQGVFVDIGSTTSDLIALHAGRVSFTGYSDAERLATQELFYTGVVRTPVMAVADRAPFAGQWQGLAAEHFATMADVYRLTGDLEALYDQSETADGADKSVQSSARRLARMTGRDLEDATLPAWRQLAGYFKSAQLAKLENALRRTASCFPLAEPAPLIAAGAGAFLVRQLAQRLGHPCLDAASLIGSEPDCRPWAAVCLPAYAVAWLAEREAGC